MATQIYSCLSTTFASAGGLPSPHSGQTFVHPPVMTRYQYAPQTTRGQIWATGGRVKSIKRKIFRRCILSPRNINAVCARARHLVDSVIITWKIIKQYLRALFKTKNSHGCASIKRIPFRFYTYSPQFRQIALFAWLCVAESDYKVAREPGEQRMFAL